ncbi:MAG: GmrSD restriction endonuclease domain-containing protein [Pseudonocardiaceae bacterium]
MPFDSPDLNLGDELLKDVGSGKIRLPDFQRDWKWEVDRIASLLASVSLGYPVGVVMLLETGGADVEFATRLVSGVQDGAASKPAERLILDGQQRLTSLYQSLASSQPVQTRDTRKKKLERRFYLDMAIALDPEGDREAAIVAVPADRRIRDNFGKDIVLDLSTTEAECVHELFPLGIVFGGPAVDSWMVSYLQLDQANMPERLKRWSTFREQVLDNFTGYTVPVIVLRKETPREAVCTVFEKVNTGGVVLDVFELLTATFAANEFDLREDWEARRKRLDEHKVLRGLQSTDFLQAVSLLATLERRVAWKQGDSDKAPAVSCKRRDILRLTREEYVRWAPEVEKGFAWAATFLNGEMIFEARDVPYRTQIVPLAAIHVALGTGAEAIGKVEKIRRWFWCGVLGELYGGAIETRFANDLQQVTEWCAGGTAEPITVYESSFDPGRLLTLRTRNSAAYKGIYALLMRGGSKDWLFDQDMTIASHHSLAVDIHHVFPKKWCADHKIDDLRRESIVNKTAISATTNRKIGGRAPSKYLPLLQREGETTLEELRRRIEQHHVDYDALEADDFAASFELRRQRLLDLIGHAMGKSIIVPRVFRRTTNSTRKSRATTTSLKRLPEAQTVRGYD